MKNKHTFFISLLSALILFCQVSFAEIVSVEKAQLVAKNLYFERVNLIKENNVDYQSIKFNDAIVVTRSSVPMYYAFNCVSEQGFVIVTAESNVMPILAYSFENYFSAENMNESVKEAMENYENEIAAIREKNLKADDKIIKAWEKYSATVFKSGKNITTVGPLVKTTWNQNCYYNTLCPTAAGGPCNHAYAGCVATAMAQLMKYWSHPTTGVGSNSYSSMGSHNVDFAAQTYNWAAMPLNITTENAEIAKIIYHAGVSLNMNYSAGGSSASTQQAASKLKNHFKYSATTEYVNKASYTNVNWHILIRSNLIDGKPLMYRGTGSYGGHSFIVDGFQYPEHYHINWGWGSSLNAYFYLDNLNSGNGEFTNGQGAIINCYPLSSASTPTNIKENDFSNEVKVSPNPNNGQFLLTINNARQGSFTITIMDIASRVILKKTINKEHDVVTEEMIVPELINGFYFVSVEGEQFKSINKFIVK